MFDLAVIPAELAELGLDGWLLYDFPASNVLARRVLDMETKPAGSRRFLYIIPATGEPTQLVHRDQDQALDSLPAARRLSDLARAGRRHCQARGGREAPGCDRDYAPRVSNPYVSKVDAGTLEVVRGCGIDLA